MTPLRTLALTALIALAVACGSDSEPLAPATDVNPTPTPQRGEHPGIELGRDLGTPPVESIADLVAPSPVPIEDLSPDQWTLLELGNEREYPAAIEPDAERLPSDIVASLWTDYLSDTRIIDDRRDTVALLCGDGTGFATVLGGWNVPPAPSGDDGMTWNVERDRGGRWYEAILRMNFNDSNVQAQLDNPDSGYSIGLRRDERGTYSEYRLGTVITVAGSPSCAM